MSTAKRKSGDSETAMSAKKTRVSGDGESALDCKPPNVKKAKTQYQIFKDLVKASEGGSGLGAKELTKVVQTESARIKKELGAKDDAYSQLWRRARDMEASEASNLTAATAKWAEEACDEACALFASTPAAQDDFAALEFVVDKVSDCADAIRTSGADRDKIAAAAVELNKARALLGGYRKTACAATVDAVVKDLAAAKDAPVAKLAAAEASGKAWLARFAKDGDADAVARVRTAYDACASTLATKKAGDAKASGEALARDVAAACAAAADVADLVAREAALEAASAMIGAWEAGAGAGADAATAGRVALFRKGLARAISQVRDVRADAALVNALRSADDAAMMAHAAEFRERKCCIDAQTKDITGLLAFKAKSEKKAASGPAPADLPKAVGKALASQIVYFKGLKDGTKSISFALGGVSPDAFRAAFGEGPGLTRTSTAEALGIAPKVLKAPAPGADPPSLVVAGDVKLKLKGGELSATAAYKMEW